jgi:PAS domain S-box-containing protein
MNTTGNLNTSETFKLMLEKLTESLEMSERKFRTLIEKSHDMLTMVSAEGNMLYASPAVTRILGYTLSEYASVRTFALIHPDDVEECMKKGQEVMSTPGKSVFLLMRVRHKNGRWIWCEGTISNLLEEKGVNAIVSNFRDITESKVANEMNEQREKRFHDFFENAPEGITILDVVTMKFVAWNSNALKLSKYTEEEMRVRGPQDMSPEFQLDGQRSDEKAMELIMWAVQGEKIVFEWLTVDGEGKTFMAEIRLVLIENGGSPQLYASFVDITARKKTEAILLKQNKRLSEVSFLQAHQVRKPIAHILGLINLFNLENSADPINAEVLVKIRDVTNNFDKIIHEIVEKTSQINWDLNFK